MGVFKTIEPLYIVASQFHTLTAEGMATSIVIALKIVFSVKSWLSSPTIP